MRKSTVLSVLFIICFASVNAQDSLAHKPGWILTRNYPLNNFDSIINHFDPIFPWGPYTGGDHSLTYNYENVNVGEKFTSIEAIKEVYEGEL